MMVLAEKTDPPAPYVLIFHSKMLPITRFQLQNAPAAAAAEKKRSNIREQELVGQLFAETVRERVLETAKMGRVEYETHFPSNLTPIGHEYAMRLISEWFYDSDVKTVLYKSTVSVRINWAPTQEDVLADRRLEKETSW